MNASGPARLARLLLGLSEPVSRRAYATVGVTLMVLKYAVDAWLIAHWTDRSWTPLDYLRPSLIPQLEADRHLSTTLVALLVLWTLPFVWIGAVMTMRRALDAGVSAWVVLLYFVPGVNYLVMIALACVPAGERPAASPLDSPSAPPARLRSALLAVGVSVGLGVGMTWFVTRIPAYGLSLFFGTPFLIGVLAAYFHNRPLLRSWWQSASVSLIALLITCGLVLLFALEGIVCIVMALGIAVPVAVLGATIGWAVARASRARPGGVLGALVALPFLHALEAWQGPPPSLHEVVSVVEVDAPPERVWRHVVSFSELPPPTEFLFTTGVAYPVRARIDGEGVGAVRRCEFSTGAFVEPITVWEPPARLAFDVASQPDPMQEWSFYARVRPPHLERAFRSVRGEFRLVPLPGGRTRLEGSTWYELDLAPRIWWRLLSDRFVQTIHGRVLEHVKTLAESAG